MKKSVLLILSATAITLILASCNNDNVSDNGKDNLVSSRMTTIEQYRKQNPTPAKVKNIAYVFLINKNDNCDTQKYEDLAVTNSSGDVKIAKKVDLYTYTLLNLLIPTDSVNKIDKTDMCLKMAFPRSDKKQLASMRKLLKKDMQDLIENTNYDETAYDLPTDCDELKELLKNKVSTDRLDSIYEKCKQKQQDFQSDEQDKEDMYNTTTATCNISPNIDGCSPKMTEEEYVKYAMNYITPTNQTVIDYAQQFKNLADLYKAYQQNHWQSDKTIFGCGDYFQKPEYYLNSSPTLKSNMICSGNYEDKAGDCDDQSNAFTSSIIASGLYKSDEVRIALGNVDFGDGVGGHEWTEVWMNDHWVVVDPVWGDTCYDNGKCYIYDQNDANHDGFSDKDLIPYDYFNYVPYNDYIVNYWGVANNQHYCTYDTDTKIWSCDSSAPSSWKQSARTAY
ncbi:MAG: hypothetical protein UR28_C0032G0008 [Candidatus Peregrinibacteria bacterium GW2011_GWF2_33_10]|nr:MAG: hypothetical protein UR28_C0032G0008 [Candidatus Peregrinibacteria bacterium GW2011_GWF2_33_10]OGJ44440.1 MAG: hypothetical protein A2272_01160 [Candidatus Peregrinibacteria bacterium RIFOXYA12_FULL_33_12]OGJ45006.1 MAG: hypothetical protein A2263_03015 [Candidatus Peregrinibacteria bacterium RIFOXYA2_FULL_33_21]OGJ51708.1 MAG: hypothetical protein A2307_05365 [Candidatus Peregrinibacteria bacterium RIFOXYB2_FULL_33_20]